MNAHAQLFADLALLIAAAILVTLVFQFVLRTIARARRNAEIREMRRANQKVVANKNLQEEDMWSMLTEY